MRDWIRKHRKATIWLVAIAAVGIVLVLRSRLAGAAQATVPDTLGGSATDGTVSAGDPLGTFASGYDAGFSSGLGTGGSIATVGGGGKGGVGSTSNPAGTKATKEQRLAQILKDLAKPGLTAARRLQLQTTYHQITGKKYTVARNPYKHPPKRKQPKNPAARATASGQKPGQVAAR